MQSLFQRAWDLIQENKRAYIIINAVYYGLVVVFMAIAAFNKPLQDELLQAVGASLTSGPLAMVRNSYLNADVLRSIGLTFVINLIGGSFASITLPSLLIPFSGMLMGAYRAILWGLIFSPAHPEMRLIMIPHALTLILEGQGYILAMLAAYIQGRAFLWPEGVKAKGRWQGYLEGLRRTGFMYVLVTAVLIIAAVYEVIEVIILVEFFR